LLLAVASSNGYAEPSAESEVRGSEPAPLVDGPDGLAAPEPSPEPPLSVDASAPLPVPPTNSQAPLSVPEAGALSEPGATREAVIYSTEEPTETKAINTHVRFDGNFFTGSGGVEGFSLPSYRLSLFGVVSPHIRYRMSLGQAREFSSVLLPQVVPVEAFAVFAAGNRKKNHATITAGLFAPSLVPWWTPDLSDLPIPEYASVHRAMLLGRELGTELTVAVVPGSVEASVAFVNGTGIFGSQSGATRAVTGMVRAAFGTPAIRVMLGAGGYYLTVGTLGTSQFRQQTVVDAFLQLRVPRLGVMLGADAIFGQYVDAFRKLAPSGGNVFLLANVASWADGFGRYEFLDRWWGDRPSFRRVEVGPVFRLDAGVRLFVLVVHEQAEGRGELGGEARLRLQL
jgi:hypothetical protein